MADPQVGTLFPDPTAPYPRYKQPGGIGTASVPSQPPQPYESAPGFAPALNPVPYAEQLARFKADCGHAFQSYEIKSAAVGGVRSAVICCPQCSFVIKILTPYEIIYSPDFVLF